MTEPLMQSSILPRAAFQDPGLYDTEQRLVGERYWALLGPAEWVAADGAWMTGRVADREVFVQRFGERLVAFENACSHRFSQIRTSRRGCGPIQCPYHGWTFNAQGVPVGIPHCRELFGVAPHQLAARRLQPIELTAIGQMVFGRLPGTVREERPGASFGRWSALFAALDRRSLELFGESEQTIRANWKLGFQNTLDEYHITAVHPKSFGSGGWLQPGQFRYQVDGTHHAMVLKRAGLGDIDADAVVRAIADGTPLPVDYAIYHFFPDFLVGFVAGRIVMVTRYEAIDVGETRVRTYLFDMLPPGGRSLTAQKRSAMANYVVTVLEEDREAVERWSKGLRQAWAMPLHGLQEQRLTHFERSWASLVPVGAGAAAPQG
jgi:phenylpropionate dioxygenase-like ring-hydroxylating dioxygenase large terminal subunit